MLVGFYRTASGSMPAKKWMYSFSLSDRRKIQKHIDFVLSNWPIGMPYCRSLSGRKGLWEHRISLGDGVNCRVFFCVRSGTMILLGGFVKKTRSTPDRELDLMEKRMRDLA